MRLEQSQIHKLSQQQIQGLELLQLSSQELDSYLQELAMANPLVELEEKYAAPDASRENELLHRLRWLEENDRQNLYYHRIEEGSLDPLANVGTRGGLEETLPRFISRQLQQLNLRADQAQAVLYLAACLDDNGYLRVPLPELAQDSAIPLSQLEEGLSILRSLEPAGIGAADLSQCLSLQLERIGETGTALAIVRTCLDALARRSYRAIASGLGLPVEEIKAAEKMIQELEPRPGAIFQRPGQIPYIQPDIFVTEEDGQFTVSSRWEGQPAFHLNSYYQALLKQSADKKVQEYLAQKLRQAENVLRAVEQRQSTLVRCTQAIIVRQKAFFHQGPAALLPLKMADVAQMLEVHESTISRTVREKYLQCAHGVYPMSYFFSRPASAGAVGHGSAAAQILLKTLIDQEDNTHPLSDQELSRRMAQAGCPISRRTVSKYREQLGIPSAAGRKKL